VNARGVELVIVEDADEVAAVTARRLARAAADGGSVVLTGGRTPKQALLDNLGGAPRAVHRIKGELGKDKAAEEYERELDDARLDLLLLGIGPDGHIASLFPNTPTLRERRRVLPAEAGLEPFVDRVTLSLPTLRAAAEILFVVAGEEKADAVRRAFAEKPGPGTPASLVRSDTGPTTAILDRAAAARIEG